VSKRLEEIKQMQYDGYTIWDMGEDNLVWLIEQTERVQELESELQELRKRYLILTKENNQVNDELIDEFRKNKRYREYLELIKTTGTYGKDISTGEIIRSDEANLADEALEVD